MSSRKEFEIKAGLVPKGSQVDFPGTVTTGHAFWWSHDECFYVEMSGGWHGVKHDFPVSEAYIRKHIQHTNLDNNHTIEDWNED